MYNGIGLTTPRGSGTSGYVVRNLSHLRHHETAVERAAALIVKPPKHREPDAAILEHERKRKVEIRCYELQVELEDKGMDEDAIKEEVDALRNRLIKNLSTLAPSAKELKLTDTHGRAAAKKMEIDKMARALDTRADYTEGEAFDREKQEESKQQRAIERAERERRREEEREKREQEKEKWEAIRRERERLRRRQEDQARRAREEMGNRDRDRGLPPNVPTGPRRREPSLRRSQTRSPPPPLPPPHPASRRGRSPSPSRSRSRSRSPVRHRSASANRRMRSRSPPYRRRGTRSPPPIRRRSRSGTRSDMRRSRSPRRPPPRSYKGFGYGRRLSPPPRSPSRERRSGTPPPPTRRLSSRSPPHRHISPSPPPRRRGRSTTPPRGTGFGERIVDDRSPINGGSRSPPSKSHRRSLSRGSSGSEMSVSGSEG